jgi:hypothetical protein
MNLSSLSLKNKIEVFKRFAFFEVFVAFLVTFYHSKNLFWGQLYGEPFDTRLMILIHEHWWRWFNGKTSFRNMEFFYPIDNSFGYSDTFLVQGLLHSLFRLIGFPMVQAWLITTFLCLLFGMIGWAYLSRELLNNALIRILFVISIGISYTFTVHFTSVPNFVGYTWISWVLIIFIKIIRNKSNAQKVNLFIIYLVITFLVLVLSAWYAAFFVFQITLVYFVILFINRKWNHQNIITLISRIDYRKWALFSPVIFSMVWMFTYVYLSVLGDPNRPISEMTSNSYNPIQILNGSYYGGGLFGFIYSYFNFDKLEVTPVGMGVGSSLTIFIILLITLNLRWRKRFCLDAVNKNFLLLFLSSLIVQIYYTKIFSDISLHKLFYQIIPGLTTIRSPNRYLTILSFFIILTFFLIYDNYLKQSLKRSRLKLSILTVIFAFLIIDQLRFFPDNTWTEEQFYDEKINAQSSNIKENCDYFIYDAPGGWWSDQIKGMVFAYQLDVPTVNGYSGAFPPDYPVQEWLHEGDISGVFAWINNVDINLRGCFTTGDLPIFYLNAKESRFEFEDGFTSEETNGKSKWRWANRNRSFAFLYSPQDVQFRLNFKARAASCLNSEKLEIIKLPNEVLYSGVVKKEASEYQIDVNMKKNELAKIEFKTNDNFCIFENDPRQLFYEVKDWKLSIKE